MKIETINITKKLIVELPDGDYKNLFIPKDVDGMDESIYALLPACNPKPKTITVEEGNTAFCVKSNCLIKIATKTLIFAAQNATIPNDGSVEIIKSRAFYSMPNMPRELVIPNGVKSIGELAFSDTNIEKVIIPYSVEKIGRAAFRNINNSPKLKEIIVDSANPNYYVQSNCLIDRHTKTVVHVCDLTAKEIVVPKGVERIGSTVFFVTNEKVYLPSTVKEIEDSNFIFHSDGVICDGSKKFFDYCAMNHIILEG